MISKLKTRDFWNGLILAVGAPLLYFVQEWIPQLTIHPLLKIAIGTFVAYLIKNVFTSQQTKEKLAISTLKESPTTLVEEFDKKIVITTNDNTTITDSVK